MIAVIRIKGQVNLSSELKENLKRLNIRRKYACTLLKPSVEVEKLLQKVRNAVAYGDIDNDTLKALIEKRAQSKEPGKKVDSAKVIAEIEKKNISDLSIKPFFRLHPPIGGIDAKVHFGVSRKGVLGDNKAKINDLIRRML